MSRDDHNESTPGDENLKTEPIHAAPAESKGDGEEVRPSDATLPSDEPEKLARRDGEKIVKICKSCMVSQRDGGSFCVDCGAELVPIRSVQDSCIGDVVGEKFTIVDKIGSGGMGDVYRGINEPIGQQVAIKFLNEKFTFDEKIVLRFLNEARSYCKVNHPNAVTLLEYGQHDDGSLYLITEFIEGEDLTDVVRREGPLSTETITYVGVQMCEVLSAAHNQGIIHRDLKPDNLMVIHGSRGRYAVKVLDFGIAKIADDDRTGPMTETGSVFGTPEFMSPEQARGDTADPRSDLYALGAILYYMSTAKLPFRGKNKFTILNAQLNDDPVPPSQVCNTVEVHPELEKIIMQCLEKSPTDRPQTADEIAEALEEIDWRSESTTRRKTAPSHRQATSEATKKKEEQKQSTAIREETPDLDGPAHDAGPAEAVSMSTFDNGADEALDLEIDDESGVDALGVTIGDDAADDDEVKWEDSLDTDAPDRDVSLGALEQKYTSKRHSALLGALATLVVIGGLIWWSGGEDSPTGDAVDGVDAALAVTDDGRAAAMLASTEELIDQGLFSEAEVALETFTELAGDDSSYQDRYDEIVARASRARNVEMRIRSHVETANCDRAEQLLDNLGGLSTGAAQQQIDAVESCGEPVDPEVADAASSSADDDSSPSVQTPPAEPTTPPVESPPPLEVEEHSDSSDGDRSEDSPAEDEDVAQDVPTPEESESSDSAEEDDIQPSPPEDSLEGDEAEPPEEPREPDDQPEEVVNDEDSEPGDADGQPDEEETAPGEDAPSEDEGAPSEDEDEDVVLPPSEI